jgi:glycine oxidase
VETADVVIGGAGIIGLTAALSLAQRGFRVRVIERGAAMAGASWAAAGMLAAEDPDNPSALREIAALSRRLYPEYLASIESLSGRAVPIRTKNALQTTSANEEFHCETSPTRASISPREAALRIPGLEAAGRSLLWLDEWSLDPRDLCSALPQAVRNAGVTLDKHTEIKLVNLQNTSARVTTSSGTVATAAFLNCCGAWSSSIPQMPEDGSASLPVPTVLPKKGQMAVVRMDGPVQLEHVVRTPDVYLVPRGDRRVVVGATVEDAGFDIRVAQPSLDTLVAKAAQIWPPIRTGTIVESWAGLRPGTTDQLPLIGNGGWASYWLATGHFRNGILLAPATGRLICLLLEGGAPSISLDAFDPLRSPTKQLSHAG